jgi:hypothetical protein
MPAPPPESAPAIVTAEIDRILAEVDDPLGYAYRFSLPSSVLKRKVRKPAQRVTVEEVASR